MLRFNGREIRESLADYCVPQIAKTITRLGGLADEGLVAHRFYSTSQGLVQQLSLFEDGVEYELD